MFLPSQKSFYTRQNFVINLSMNQRIYSKILFLAFSLILALQALSQEPVAVSLTQAQEFAVQNSYAVKNSQIDLLIAEKQVKQNISLGLPQVDASLDYTYFPALPTSLIPGEFFGQPGEYIPVQFGTNNNLMFSVFLNQLIFDGRYFIGLEYAKSYREMSQKLLNKSEIDVKAMVASTYYNILVLEEVKNILDSNLAVMNKTLYEMQEMYNEGFVEVTDVDQLTLTVTDLENMINNTGLQIETSYKLLKVQMGIPLDKEIVLTQTMEAILAEIDLQAVAEQPFNINNNIDYNIFSSEEEMKLLNLKNEKAAYLPSITGFFSWSENAQDNEFSMLVGGSPYFTSVSVGASLKVPIFSGGYRKARVQQAKLMLDQVQINKVQLTENLQLAVFRARSAFITALQNYYKEISNVGLSRGIYDRTMLKYREGIATSAELTQQYNQFLQAERQYFQTLLLLLNAKNELDKTLGNY